MTEPQRELRTCLGCGDRVGAYEPAWAELRDCTFRPASLLRSGAIAPERVQRLWHLGCVPAGQLRADP